MMRILICMMAAVALAILVVSGCGEVKEPLCFFHRDPEPFDIECELVY